MLRMHGFEARSGELASRSAHDLRRMILTEPERAGKCIDRAQVTIPIATLVRLDLEKHGRDVGNPGRGFGISLELFCASARPGPS
jgi:hypothetical protein